MVLNMALPAQCHRVALSTRNQALAAILFLCPAVIENDLDRKGGVVLAKKPKRLPVVLTRDAAQERVHDHLKQVRQAHQPDLREGMGHGYLPEALARKYPRQPRVGLAKCFPCSLTPSGRGRIMLSKPEGWRRKY